MPLLGPTGAPLDGGNMHAQAQPAPDAPPVPQEVVTAFLAIQLTDGRWVAVSDLDAPVVPQRVAIPDDLIAGAAMIQADMTARRAADMAATQTIQTQFAINRQLQAQKPSAQEARITADLLRGAGR